MGDWPRGRSQRRGAGTPAPGRLRSGRPLKLRTERASDHAAVERVVTAAFGGPTEARLVAALRDSVTPSVSLVAELDGVIAGHIFVSPVTIEGKPEAPACAGLAPVSVSPEAQRGGVGSALVYAALDACRDHGWRAVFLVGDPLYYQRFGFELAMARGFHYESYEFDSAFQVLELRRGALRGWSGWVRYPGAFDDLS